MLYLALRPVHRSSSSYREARASTNSDNSLLEATVQIMPVEIFHSQYSTCSSASAVQLQLGAFSHSHPRQQSSPM